MGAHPVPGLAARGFEQSESQIDDRRPDDVGIQDSAYRPAYQRNCPRDLHFGWSSPSAGTFLSKKALSSTAHGEPFGSAHRELVEPHEQGRSGVRSRPSTVLRVSGIWVPLMVSLSNHLSEVGSVIGSANQHNQVLGHEWAPSQALKCSLTT